ncbi:major facilitator superfamily protein [Striga asiatica]|uniref:Major facilitator superfamily protein n=1 Tax=Striga asiatica TaxID=4170 RepID=A0A5A7Q1F6_STRAF|nr:major facilitator superfamily protein [Striga asiatica]
MSAISCVTIPSGEDDTVQGMVDHVARPARRYHSGYWRSASYIIGAGSLERFAYFGIGSNLITYLTGPLRQSTASAAASINVWSGTGLLLPLFGALVIESYLGRYRTIVLSSLLYILALGLLTTSAFILRQGGGFDTNLQAPRPLDILFFYVSLYLMAIGQGLHKPCIMAFGADQFDDRDPVELKSRGSFFNWWYFASCAGPLAALLVLNYIQDNVSWGIGFGIPCVAMAIGLGILMLGAKFYRYRVKTDESCALMRVGRVLVKAATNWRILSSTSACDEEEEDSMPHLRTRQFKFLNKALLTPNVSTDHDPTRNTEDARPLSKLLPLWATSLPFALVMAQPSTLYTKQAITMDRALGPNLDLPAASLQYTVGLTIILSIPIYDRALVPLARLITKMPSGLTPLQRIGTGMFLCTVSAATAALVEHRRLEIASLHGLSDLPSARVPMSFWWLVPQNVVYGVADVFALVGLQEVFYDEAPCGLKAVGLSVYLSIIGIGSFLSSFLICVIQRATSEGGRVGWFADNTNRAHLDYFYWLLCGLNAVGFLGFVCCAKSFTSNGHRVVGT